MSKKDEKEKKHHHEEFNPQESISTGHTVGQAPSDQQVMITKKSYETELARSVGQGEELRCPRSREF